MLLFHYKKLRGKDQKSFKGIQQENKKPFFSLPITQVLVFEILDKGNLHDFVCQLTENDTTPVDFIFYS